MTPSCFTITEGPGQFYAFRTISGRSGDWRIFPNNGRSAAGLCRGNLAAPAKPQVMSHGPPGIHHLIINR